MLHTAINVKCPECFAYNLGHHSDPHNVTAEQAHRGANQFDYGTVNNIGLVLPDQSLRRMVDQKRAFCDFDEYNWDLTMNRMSQLLAIGDQSLRARISRVVHIGYVVVCFLCWCAISFGMWLSFA